MNNKLHLNWDNIQTNGVVVNDIYKNGIIFYNDENRPKLSFDYDSFIFTEDGPSKRFDIIINDKIIKMTEDQKNEIKELALNWEQPLGMPGNPTGEQKRLKLIKHYRNVLNTITIFSSNENRKYIPKDVLEDMEILREKIFNFFNDNKSLGIIVPTSRTIQYFKKLSINMYIDNNMIKGGVRNV